MTSQTKNTVEYRGANAKKWQQSKGNKVVDVAERNCKTDKQNVLLKVEANELLQHLCCKINVKMR